MRLSSLVLSFAVLSAISVLSPSASAAGNPTSGAARFRANCEVCHLASKTATPNDLRSKVGPNLWGVVGRKAGATANFKYSRAMKTSGVTWTPALLRAYALAPQKMIPNVRMTFRGVKTAQEADDIVAWLATQK